MRIPERLRAHPVATVYLAYLGLPLLVAAPLGRVGDHPTVVTPVANTVRI